MKIRYKCAAADSQISRPIKDLQTNKQRGVVEEKLPIGLDHIVIKFVSYSPIE